MHPRFTSSLLLVLLLAPLSLRAEPIYRSSTLEVHQIAEGVYQHISYLQAQEFGKVACNGIVVVDSGEALVVDTPTDAPASLELIDFIEQKLESKVVGVVCSHFHIDCLGGLSAFHQRSVPSTASKTTISLAKLSGKTLPQTGFEDRAKAKAGALEVDLVFPGAGHTSDNIVAYIPKRKLLFGGCLVKSLDAAKGNLADADTAAWPQSIARIRELFPEIESVVPGHGAPGDTALLDYTQTLFSPAKD